MESKTILIVDDQIDIIKLIVSQLRLENKSWKILSATNGNTALEIAKQEQPDLILMDWDMPIMNGIEATRLLKKEEDTHQIPIVIVTGQMTSSDDLQIALEAGASDYLRKPIDFVEMRARILSVLRSKEQQLAIQALLKNEIDLKNRKLSTTSMLIVEKNAIIKEFYDELTDFGKILTSRSNQKLEELEQSIKALTKRTSYHLETDDSWDTFKIHFDEVHPQFFQALKKYGEDISHKDLKLCAYLKLGMDTKEIAQLLNITPGSIRTAMYRLKKKFDIDKEADLRGFIGTL